VSRLFPPAFVGALERLRLAARVVPRHGTVGDHVSRQSGSGVEFRDHRAYAPGDDLRRLDWNLYLRFRRPRLRLFDEPRDLAVHLLVDASGSLLHGGGVAFDAARRAAAVPGAIALGQHDRVVLCAFGSELAEPRSFQGKGALPSLLAGLEALEAGGRTDFEGCVGRFAALPLRRGLVVLVSDFYDPRGLDAVGRALRGLRHRLLLVRVYRGSERDPSLGGELLLRDVESGESLDVTVTDRTLARYREALAAFEHGLGGLAGGLACPLLAVDAERPVLEQAGVLFHEDTLRV